jgi:ribokinase
MDLVGRVPRLPAAGETVLGSTFARYHGGKGGNQAVAAARLGAPVRFFGAVGQDAFGDELVADLAVEGVDVTPIVRTSGPSGCALISVDAHGDNAISVLPGANLHAPPPPADWPGEVRWLLLQLETPMPVTLAWARAADAAGAQVLLNAAPMASLPPELLKHVDTLLINHGELRELVGGGDDLEASLHAASALGPRRVVATLGGRGCVALDGDRFYRLPAREVWMVDSTGAGDTFAGALACGLWQGRSFADALARANLSAALSCTRAGARGGMPSGAELEQALSE